MDPALTTLVLGSLNSAATAASQEAGKHLWQSLAALVRRARRQPDARVESEPTEGLVAALIDAAGQDPHFAEDLRDWIAQVARFTQARDIVNNSIGESAHVAGNVVQARDITGPVTFS